MDTWFEYRMVWAQHWWVAIIPIIGALFVLGAIVGMIAGTPAAVLFVPGLAALFIHHLIVQKARERKT